MPSAGEVEFPSADLGGLGQILRGRQRLQIEKPGGKFRDDRSWQYVVQRDPAPGMFAFSDRRGPTNRIDLEYCFYLPFTLGFSSGDQLHRDLFEHVALPKNDFCYRDDLKHDFRCLWSHREHDPEALEAVKPPELAPDSFTCRMWDKHMKPVSQRRENLAKSLSPEEQHRLIEQLRTMMDGEMDNDTAPECDQDFLFRKMQIHRDGPCVCGSSKSFRESVVLALNDNHYSVSPGARGRNQI